MKWTHPYVNKKTAVHTHLHCPRYCRKLHTFMWWNDITLFSFVYKPSLKPQMNLLSPAFPSRHFSADMCFWEVPAVLLSLRATNLTKQGSRSMSPFVTCHWGTSWAAGTPSGGLGQEGVLQLPVPGRFLLVPCCPPGTNHPTVPIELSERIWPVLHPSGETAAFRRVPCFHHLEERVRWLAFVGRDPPFWKQDVSTPYLC